MTIKKHSFINGVGKRCVELGCATSPRCDHPWHLRKQGSGKRVKGPLSDFVHLWPTDDARAGTIPKTRRDAEDLARAVEDVLRSGQFARLDPPAAAPVALPLTVVPMPTPAAALTFNDLLDRYLRWKELEQRNKKQSTAEADAYKVKAAREAFGAEAVDAIDPDCLRGYVLGALNAGKKIGTPNSILAAVVSPALRWGLEQDPPLVAKNPFGRYRFRIDRSAEGKRTRRCTPAEEFQLLDAAGVLKRAEYNFAGQTVEDFIILAIDTGARSEELFQLRNGAVDWHACTLELRRTKNGQTRLVPFNPTGRVAAILQRRRFAGQEAPVLIEPEATGKRAGRQRVRGPLTNIQKSWVHTVCIANGIPYRLRGSGGYFTRETAAAYKAIDLRPHDLRHETATWLGLCGCSDETAEFMQGHRKQTTHGRYKHEDLQRAIAELRAKVWPREGERARREPKPKPKRKSG